MASPTARTLSRLRADGWLAQVVEKWIPQTRRRQDLFGCIDLVAVQAGMAVLGVQATSSANVSARLRKSLALPGLEAWLRAGAAFQVWGWAKRGAKGRRKLWTLTWRAVTLRGDSYRVEDEHGNTEVVTLREARAHGTGQ